MENHINVKCSEALSAALESSKNAGATCCLALIEVDGDLKSTGSESGEYLEFHEIYKTIQSGLQDRNNCFFSSNKLHYSVILPETNLLTASKIIENICDQLGTLHLRFCAKEALSFYVGMAHVTSTKTLSSDELIERAAAALKVGKDGGSNKTIYYGDLNYFV